jgi:competence protein ComEC
VLATHPDADHIGGLSDVLDRFKVAHIIRTENESDTFLWEEAEEKIEAEGAVVTIARRGQRFDLGSGVFLDILFPDVDVSEYESNTASIVARLMYGETSFMLTGDSPKSIEEYLVLIEGENLESDVLKAGHHGSRTSTSELFLAEVSPSYAVISAGKDNSYGHPHLEVTDALFNASVETFNTADQGHIIFWSDGENLTVK